ncbi:MAG: outer membrane protein assembly factor BamC [Methylovulum sp.]|uniref:outer membrane protein assembly factor BamC n=1 Tax=Methylovulum sp. TaxID=1916980 RepID=UPI002612CF76|nr:outer membrane protein assembly factor BamC [Methylovulum sp.]MDD2724791.1 outer membrane protein assembly factor BamC [Methylovulum sp.]MDD5124611.1 outer membrane protein assembly factor BamC [Methylovulum sp.]
MKAKILLIITGMLALNLLTACGTIKSLFPDKEKDYQYTTEIPALVLPADLAKGRDLKPIARTEPALANKPETNAIPASAVEKTPEALAPATVLPNEAPEIASPALSETPASETKANTTPIKHEPIPVTLQKSAEGVDILRLAAPFETSWRAIDKALSRKSIEVTNRNKAEKTFALHFDPDEKALEDQSLWHEALFIFSGLQNNEQEFTVKLTDQGQQTDVTVLDKEQKPATDASAARLLNLLQDTIKSDFAK